MLEKGTAPWQKPWDAGSATLPFNPTSERNYRGGNALHLMATAARKGFNDPRWLTYRQAQENGWQVRQGEKGTQIEYWQFDDRSGSSRTGGSQAEPDTPGQSEEGAGRRAPIHRVYTVFNAQQMDGVPAHQPKQRNEWEVAQTGEQILQNSGASIAHDQSDRAFYSRSQDAIHLPQKDAFRTASDYYGTALHELAHWTGHPARLNRQTLNESYRFGDPNYAKEELRAELTSVFLAAERGIPHDPEQHAAYVGSWISALKNDKNEIFRAAKDAHTAADYLLGLERTKEVEAQFAPQIRTETSEHVAAYEKVTGTVNIVEKETANREPESHQNQHHRERQTAKHLQNRKQKRFSTARLMGGGHPAKRTFSALWRRPRSRPRPIWASRHECMQPTRNRASTVARSVARPSMSARRTRFNPSNHGDGPPQTRHFTVDVTVRGSLELRNRRGLGASKRDLSRTFRRMKLEYSIRDIFVGR